MEPVTKHLQGWLVLVLLVGTMAYAMAAQESLTVTTFYPSPRGAYNELRAREVVLENDGNLTVRGSLAVGSELGGYDPGLAGDVLIEGNVGIGTTDPSTRLEVVGNLSVADNQLQNVRALQLKDWDDDSGGIDDKYRLLARDGAWQFFNGGVVVGNYANGTWGDLVDGRLIVEGRIGIGTTAPTEALDIDGRIRLRTGAQNNRVLTSNATGRATWKNPQNAIKLCYCIRCREGDNHGAPGWKCNSAGGATSNSDDANTGEGCKMKAKLIQNGEPCNW